MRYPWRPFLEQWNATLIRMAEEEAWWNVSDAAIAAGWIGSNGATEAQIAAAEARLGVRLSPSYREFLQVSNGWGTTGSFIYKFWAVEELELFFGAQPMAD